MNFSFTFPSHTLPAMCKIENQFPWCRADVISRAKKNTTASKNNYCLPLGHTDYYISINLACQVSPLEDTLVSTKKDDVPLQTVGHNKRAPLHTPTTQIQHKPDLCNQTVWVIKTVTLLSTIYQNGVFTFGWFFFFLTLFRSLVFGLFWKQRVFVWTSRRWKNCATKWVQSQESRFSVTTDMDEVKE